MKRVPYPKYKASGVEWLGEVPEHWVVKKAGLGYSIQLGKMLQPKSSTTDDLEIEYLKALHVQWERIDTTELPVMWASNAEISKFSVRAGDLLVCEGGEVGRASILEDFDDVVIIQNSLHRVRSNINSVQFLLYILYHSSSQQWLDILCNKATIAHFTGDKFSSLRIPIPPLPEQQAIAAYLDRETGRIDSLISKQKHLVELLKEKRSALISRAVTRGLDASVKLKPSGVEWLGEVPEHWEVKRTRYMLKMNPSKQEINHLEPETELAFLPMESVGEDGTLQLDTTKPISEVSAGYTFFAEGDVTFAKITPCFENGKGAIMQNLGTQYGFGTTELTVMRSGNNLEAEYLHYLSISREFRKNGEAWMYGAGGQKRVPDEFVKEFRLAFPPLSEQQAIAAFLDRETAKIDALISKANTFIDKIKEYRTALISAAVTGKIDLRETV
ncbi:MAG: hypothetical protein GY765_36435 [bacterium]|nr:hypothetical protein [bacterium]